MVQTDSDMFKKCYLWRGLCVLFTVMRVCHTGLMMGIAYILESGGRELSVRGNGKKTYMGSAHVCYVLCAE